MFWEETIQILKYCNENNANLVSDPIELTGEIPQELKASFKGFASNVLGRSIHPKFIEEVYRLKLEKIGSVLKTSNEFLNSSEFSLDLTCAGGMQITIILIFKRFKKFTKNHKQVIKY